MSVETTTKIEGLELNDELIEKIKNNKEIMEKLNEPKQKRQNTTRRVNIFKGITAMPYRGSKWKFRHQINDGLKGIKLDDNLKIYDLFGGSGALSLIFKCIFPKAQITLNDYDEIIEKDGKNKIDESLKLENNVL